MRKFWDFRNEGGSRVLRIEGAIAEESWFDDDTTPKLFRDELEAEAGDIIVWINSYGGDVFAAAQIYNMLREYAGKVTVKIDGIAASAASVIAMSGDETLMSPVSCMMVHNPWTCAMGDSAEMLRAKAALDEIKQSILNAYEIKTGLSRVRISHLMDAETWMNAHRAVDLGFADGVIGEDDSVMARNELGGLRRFEFSRMAAFNSFIGKLKPEPKAGPGAHADDLHRRLNLLRR